MGGYSDLFLHHSILQTNGELLEILITITVQYCVFGKCFSKTFRKYYYSQCVDGSHALDEKSHKA